MLQPFECERKMDATFGASQGVDFIDDQCVHRLEEIAGVGAGEQQIERFGRGDPECAAGCAACSAALYPGVSPNALPR